MYIYNQMETAKYYNQQQKEYIYRWRETHPDEFHKYMNEWAKGNYEKNAEKYREKRNKRYALEKCFKEYRFLGLL